MPESGFFPAEIASVEIVDFGHVVLVRLAGEIDSATEDVVSGPLFSCLDRTPHAVVIDLAQVEFMGSTGLHLLVRAYQHARRGGVEMRLVVDTPLMSRLMEISGLDAYLPICTSLADALESIGAAWVAETG